MDCTNRLPLKVVYGDFTLGVHGECFDYIFSYAQGGLESLVKMDMSGYIDVLSLHFGEHLRTMTEEVDFTSKVEAG